jgi:NitT/TauT family transport system substrate-binding protein
MNRFNRRHQTLAAIATSFGLLLASLDSASAAGKPEMTDINIGILPTADYIPVILAKQEGYFDQEGLNVTARITTTTTSVSGLVGGDFQVSGVNWLAFITAINRKIDLLALGEADRGGPGYAAFVVKADSAIQKPADLIGKKVAVVAVNGNCDILLNETLRQLKLDFKSVRYVSLPIPDMGGNIARGGVDAACVPEPLLSAMKAQGGARLVMDLFTGVGDGFPITGFAVTADFVKKNPNTAAALQRALDKGRALASSNPEKVRAALPTYTTLKPEQTKNLVLPTYPVKSDVKALQRNADLMKTFGLLQGDVKQPQFFAAP